MITKNQPACRLVRFPRVLTWEKMFLLALFCSSTLIFQIALSLAWSTTTHQEGLQERKQHQRVRYTTHANTTYNETFDLDYHCRPSDRRAPLPTELRNVLEFTTSLALDNLKVLVMGDSVGIQLSQIVEEAMGLSSSPSSPPQLHDVLLYSWGNDHEGIHLGVDADRQSVVAGWRILGMLLQSGAKQMLPNRGPGWKQKHVNQLLQYPMPSAPAATSSIASAATNATTLPITRPIGSFDVFVFRIPYGWIGPDAITPRTLRETIDLANRLFGATTVIFITLPFVNNVQTEEDMMALEAINVMLSGLATEWADTRGDSPVENVMLLRLDRFMNRLILANARFLGMISPRDDISTTTITSKWDVIDQRCCTLGRKKLNRSIAHICGEPNIPANATSCVLNSITVDGMHLCFNAVGGRLVAGLACLMGCVYNTRTESIGTCQRRCNNKFMSLLPVEYGEHW